MRVTACDGNAFQPEEETSEPCVDAFSFFSAYRQLAYKTNIDAGINLKNQFMSGSLLYKRCNIQHFIFCKC